MTDFPNPNCELFCFDDLLVSVCQEIMSNGMETDTIPETIKDWLSGKLVRALPKRLTQKLLSYFLDNRDMDGVLAFKENNYAEVPEFTILMYRSEKAKERKEKQLAAKKREFVEQNGYDPTLNLPSFPNGVRDDDQVPENVFNETQIVDEEGISFYGEEMIVDPTTKVPLKPSVKIAQMSVKSQMLTGQLIAREFDSKFDSKILPKYPKNDKGHVESEPESYSDNTASEPENSNRDKPKRKRRSKNGKKAEPQGCFKKGFKYRGSMQEASDRGLLVSSGNQLYKRTCEVCCRGFHRPIRMYQHQAKDHPEWFAQNPPPKKIAQNREENLCRLCQPNELFENVTEMLEHQKSDHPVWWARRAAVSMPVTMENHQKVNSYEEIQVCNTSGNLTCNLCGKIWASTERGKITRHVEQIHRKDIKCACGVCGMEFTTETSLKRHMWKHTGEYPEVCEICGKKFPSKWKLKEHWQNNHKQVDCPVVLSFTKNRKRNAGTLLENLPGL